MGLSRYVARAEAKCTLAFIIYVIVLSTGGVLVKCHVKRKQEGVLLPKQIHRCVCHHVAPFTETAFRRA